MASGQLFVLVPCPPGQKYALEDVYTPTTTATAGPYENIPVWAYNAATAENMDFYGRAVGYGSSGLTFYGAWLATVTATTSVVWQAAIRRIADDAEDLDAAHTYDFNSATDVNPSNLGEISDFTITFSDGADMDSLANNEAFILRLRRNATATGDDHATNAYILQGGVQLKET